ncbi:glycosyltransferase family 31 protein [Zasmidium cellare ATCC 36951]|uniref:Glycosyltransferase family 31 protein n=1 Tax=Zasmidium cellare ATCC 36951 TaxID=1080233 RepID=A0A6A6CV85_ZASCE|nr:glycosyltransferase family 31 protein [Zasmidium cellare ATCC 36951]KAF2169719.1 glycosyltransferase family 31 protein [Zasmidium cellare ATCC 36951]
MSPKRPDPLRCRKLPGAADTLVVMKTGATDFTSQVPTHFDTTFVCAPNYIIFSDHEEIFRGHQIHDVLATVSEELRAEHPDFEIYRRLSQSGRSALAPYENKQINFKAVDGDVTGGKGDSAGWKLDKWKFLPMFHQTLTLSPGYKWYMFIEPDSAIFWSTVLKYQQQLDHSRPYYMGSQVLIGDLEFAHGGSGYLVSDAALKRVVDYYLAHKEDLEKFNEEQWAGDAVAGETFKRADASLTRVWPIVQGDHPGEFPWGRDHGDKPLWCFPTMTWHHMSAADAENMWDFEQRWIADGGLDNTTSGGYLRYRDVFTFYVQPQMKTAKSGWDNGSSDIEGQLTDLPSCYRACEKDSACLQYRFNLQTKKCTTSKEPRLGKKALQMEEFVSGWLYDRVEEWRRKRPACEEDLWIEGND